MSEQIVNITVSSTVHEVEVVVIPVLPKMILVNVNEAEGPAGLSAYEIAKLYGYQGTETEWNTRQNDVLTVTARLSEFDTGQKKYDARENLELNTIDYGTFN